MDETLYLNNCTRREMGASLSLNSWSVVLVCMWPIKCCLISWWSGGHTWHPKGSLGQWPITCRSTGWSEAHRRWEPLVHYSHSWWQLCRISQMKRMKLKEAGGLAPQPGQDQDGSPGQPDSEPHPRCFSLVDAFDLRTGGHQNYTALRKLSNST